jgi:RNA polymerase sigma factor (sigma-70 family)
MSPSEYDRYPVFDIRALRGDAENDALRDAEWDRVFSHFQPRLSSYFERRAEGIVALDDLLQELWLRACLHIRTLESSSALWTWLITIGNNLLRDELRRKRPETISLDAPGGDGRLSVDDFLRHLVAGSGADTDEGTRKLQAQLTSDEFEFLSLLCVDNLTHDEVARRLGLKSAIASRQRLRRIRQRFAE